MSASTVSSLPVDAGRGGGTGRPSSQFCSGTWTSWRPLLEEQLGRHVTEEQCIMSQSAEGDSQSLF